MVREIIHIQVGQCGNQIGNVFWNTTCDEHHLSESGVFEKNKIEDNSKFGGRKKAKPEMIQKTTEEKEQKDNNNNNNNNNNNTNPNLSQYRTPDEIDEILLSKIGVYYDEVSSKVLRFVPRSILVDLEPGTLDRIKAHRIGQQFKPDNFVMGASGCSNNWAKGRFTEGLEVVDEILDIIRREVEKCECVQAFQLTHSLGGGTGSGLGTLILGRIRDSYCDRITCAFSVYPSPTMSDVVVEPYNAVLSVNELIECCDQSFTLDNEALVRILTENKVATNVKQGFAQYNELISYVMSGITSSLRFPGQLNGDLRKMSVNLVPFPRLHFFSCSQAPLLKEGNLSNYINLTTTELTNSVLDYRSFFINLNPENGKFLSSSLVYRGSKEDITTFDVDVVVANIPYQAKYYGQFVPWIPHNFKYSLINIPCKGVDGKSNKVIDIPMSATFVSNHTAIKDSFSIFVKKFDTLYKKKAFLHWYMDEGMDEANFDEASKNLKDLIAEYQDKTDVTLEDLNLEALGGDINNKENEEDENDDDVLAKYLNNEQDDNNNGLKDKNNDIDIDIDIDNNMENVDNNNNNNNANDNADDDDWLN